jgi:calcium homeostasis endoplasmic reticulum protein
MDDVFKMCVNFILFSNCREGWEKLGLYEYFKIKNSAKKQKEEEISNETRDRSRSPTPVDIDLIRPPKKLKKRIYR